MGQKKLDGLGEGEEWGRARSFIQKKNRSSKIICKTHEKSSETHLKMAMASCGSNIIALEQHLYTDTTFGIICYTVI